MTLGSKMILFPSNRVKFEINKNEIVQVMRYKMLNYAKKGERVHIEKTVLYIIHVAY